MKENKTRVQGFLHSFARNTENWRTTTNWQPDYNKITILLMTLLLHFKYLSTEQITKYFSSAASKPCHRLPLSSFSSLFISMTTNFSQTANVGKVEEMNCPNLDAYRKKHHSLIWQMHSHLSRIHLKYKPVTLVRGRYPKTSTFSHLKIEENSLRLKLLAKKQINV